MPVDFSVKRVPDPVARRLRERAERHHRTLQRELLCILEAAAGEGIASHVAEPDPKSYASARVAQSRIGGRKGRGRLTLDARLAAAWDGATDAR